MGMFYRTGVGLVAAALILSMAVPAQAVGKDFLMRSKFHSALMFGLGGVLVKQAFDAKKEANDAYDLYKQAGTSALAREFYDNSKRHDTRAAVLGVAGGAAILFSVHLFMKEDESGLPPPEINRGIVNIKGVALDIKGDVFQRKMQVQLKKGF
ncbi:MAG: hypothetical protein OXI23_06335 [Gemmatimonadota bacterium]|nr:hypothetical protein [Gemmatimonadota bacterium]